MPYTIWSQGRKLGETELGFARIIPVSRMGWFIPMPEYETLMPVVTGVQVAFYENASRADVAAAHQHCESLQFELRRDDGSVVPTTGIGFQDVEVLLAWSAREELLNPRKWEDVGDTFLEWAEQDDSPVVRECLVEGELDLNSEPSVGVADPPFPRYQIFVDLVDAGDIP